MNHLIFLDYFILQEHHGTHLMPRFRRTASGNFTINSTSSSIALPARRPFINSCQLNGKFTFENISYACFMGMLLLLSFIGNSMVVVAICSSRKLRVRVTAYFIVSLAIADFLTAVAVIPFYISVQFHQNGINLAFCHGVGACFWYILGESSGTVASILNLFFIAIDRFIAIRFPFRHRVLFSAKRVKKMIICIWMFAILYPVAGIFPWSSKYAQEGTIFTVTKSNNVCHNRNRPYFAASFLGIYIIPLVIMTITYCVILHIAISQIRAIESTQVDDLQCLNQDEIRTNNNNIKKISKRSYKKKQRKKRLRRKELKATKSVAIVYSAFLVCWLPVCIVNCILVSDTMYFPRLYKKNKSFFLFIWYGLIQILPMVNTMINPLIYSLSNHQFRDGFKSIYLKFLCQFSSMAFSLNRVSREQSMDHSKSNSPEGESPENFVPLLER